MTIAYFSIADARGHQLSAGLQPKAHARRLAQRLADERCEPVYLSLAPAGGVEDPEKFVPGGSYGSCILCGLEPATEPQGSCIPCQQAARFDR